MPHEIVAYPNRSNGETLHYAMLEEMDVLLENLAAYRTAIKDNDIETLRQLLDDGRRIKEEVDGR